jgi:hypothetical protein
MYLLMTLALILGLLFFAALGVSHIERELIRPPFPFLRRDDESMD